MHISLQFYFLLVDLLSSILSDLKNVKKMIISYRWLILIILKCSVHRKKMNKAKKN